MLRNFRRAKFPVHRKFYSEPSTMVNISNYPNGKNRKFPEIRSASHIIITAHSRRIRWNNIHINITPDGPFDFSQAFVELLK